MAASANPIIKGAISLLILNIVKSIYESLHYTDRITCFPLMS